MVLSTERNRERYNLILFILYYSLFVLNANVASNIQRGCNNRFKIKGHGCEAGANVSPDGNVEAVSQESL